MFGLTFLNLSPEAAFALGMIVGLLLMWAIEEDLGNHRKEVSA
ncbi:hypothetical protein TK0082 [Thermococcus kodakarensis KOD1]|uniref:Uncharacterized protein n=1 Tax=Thermococcus kodakarensis (strain ATCC BAA-918 / JCM 12380 / KOD1) TaxID=69014 RepID=Q5JEH3_THEKO|nr:hypothetical protein [Thermococcus kodakarensis]WCN28196.1 hypothetical protein POG15_00440 [Thermococcus kodakarensis]WCN30493.1 hypothetical protein POG21_00440 [Thermococcus kodakarensis]BAD84271.1 hypothetical protein TK0082 [Thermococcus kodakarensis KOD1]